MDRFPLPNLKDMLFDEAEAYILGMDLKIRQIHYLKEEGGTINTVQKQAPVAGDTVRPGDKVELWIIKRDE
jgi:beta-lactam-binding protein with PASTA domain